MALWCGLVISVLLSSLQVLSAPVGQSGDTSLPPKAISDLPVKQLELLKSAEVEPSKEDAAVLNKEHVEFHRLDTVQTNGELVSRLEQHATVDKSPGENDKVHAQTKIDVPSEGVHRVLEQDGTHVSVHEVTTLPNEEPTPKVFHGAARLIQARSGSSQATGSQAGNVPHQAIRRSFNADLTKETQHNVDHYSTYSGVQYSPLDMAEYVFWTKDERGVTNAIEEFLQEGVMTKEEAIAFLQEIKHNIDVLRQHYSQSLKAAEESEQLAQYKIKNMMLEQAKTKEYHPTPLQSNLQSFPFGNSPDIIKTIASKNWELNNNLTPYSLQVPEFRPETVKRTYDPMLQTNVIGTSDYDRDGQQIVSEEEYEEMMEKLKAADNLYTQYTLEEIIYQLAKMMFSQSLSRDPASARAATQRFMAFLELEAQRGQLSRTIEKKVLDVMIAALTDTIGDHPELLQSREGFGIPSNRLMHQFLETSASEPGTSRAILSAYKDELLKGPMHFPYRDRN